MLEHRLRQSSDGLAKGEPFRPVRLTTHVVMWFDRCSVADRALVARYTKRKQEAEAEDDQAPPQVRITLELRAGSVIDDAPEERPFGRSRASLGPALAALHATRGRHRATLRGGCGGAGRLAFYHLTFPIVIASQGTSHRARGAP